MEKDKTIRILQIVPNMQAGGLENFIMNIYRDIDREKVQFDFLVHYMENKDYDNEIEKLGGKIYRFPLRNNNNIIKYVFQLNKFYKKHKEYKVIHCHMSSIGFINFLIAKKNKINVRIAHSHNSKTDKTIKGRLKKIMMLPYKYISTINFACSSEAGKFLFGNKKFEIVPNAIDVTKYKFSKSKRTEIRKKMGFEENDIVLGHIGRFNIQKNHEFLIKIFQKLYSKDKKYKLLLIGDGELKSNIENECKQYNILDGVIFTGVVSNTYDYYNAMDLFVLPSLFEGLPVVGVEAQANGLPCIFADNITRELDLTYIKYLPLNEKIWIKEIEGEYLNKNRKEKNKIIYDSDFNIHKLANKLENTYKNLYYKGETNEKK